VISAVSRWFVSLLCFAAVIVLVLTATALSVETTSTTPVPLNGLVPAVFSTPTVLKVVNGTEYGAGQSALDPLVLTINAVGGSEIIVSTMMDSFDEAMTVATIIDAGGDTFSPIAPGSFSEIGSGNTAIFYGAYSPTGTTTVTLTYNLGPCGVICNTETWSVAVSVLDVTGIKGSASIGNIGAAQEHGGPPSTLGTITTSVVTSATDSLVVSGGITNRTCAINGYGYTNSTEIASEAGGQEAGMPAYQQDIEIVGAHEVTVATGKTVFSPFTCNGYQTVQGYSFEIEASDGLRSSGYVTYGLEDVAMTSYTSGLTPNASYALIDKTVMWTGNGTNGSAPYSCEWDYLSNLYSGCSKSETFSIAESGTLLLWVNDSDGLSEKWLSTLYVQNNLTASYNINPQFPTAEQSITFTAGQAGGGVVTNYTWYDNTTSQTIGYGNIVHATFASAGTYDVTLKESDDLAEVSYITNSITIKAAGGGGGGGNNNTFMWTVTDTYITIAIVVVLVVAVTALAFYGRPKNRAPPSMRM
jgi:hypothetical protein